MMVDRYDEGQIHGQMGRGMAGGGGDDDDGENLRGRYVWFCCGN